MRRLRPAAWIFAVVALLLSLVIALSVLSRPARVAGFVMSALGQSLGLEITATGTAEYRVWRGSPMLVVRNVSVREPGAAKPLLRAQRMLVSVPWSTVRSRGAQLAITRIELDAPQLDLPALQHWLAGRPAGDSQLPTLSDGLEIKAGQIDGDGWNVDALALSLPRLQPGERVAAHVAGRYRAATLSARFDLAAAMTQPANDAGVALAGNATIAGEDWQLPVRLNISGPLHVDDNGLRIARLRASISARYRSGATDLPFAFAIHAPMVYRNGALALAPAALALRGTGVVPELDAAGTLAYGKHLLLDLDGSFARWPKAWPALPAPLSYASSPLAVSTRYLGKGDLSDVVALQVRRDDTRFDARFRVADIIAWIDASGPASPLPPLTGHFSTPRMELSGAQLEGVEIEIEDPTVTTPRDTP